jgi:hypothetical protein
LELFLDSLRTVEDGEASHTLGGAEEGFPQQRLVDSRRLLLYSLFVAAEAVSTVEFISLIYLGPMNSKGGPGACLQTGVPDLLCILVNRRLLILLHTKHFRNHGGKDLRKRDDEWRNLVCTVRAT